MSITSNYIPQSEMEPFVMAGNDFGVNTNPSTGKNYGTNWSNQGLAKGLYTNGTDYRQTNYGTGVNSARNVSMRLNDKAGFGTTYDGYDGTPSLTDNTPVLKTKGNGFSDWFKDDGNMNMVGTGFQAVGAIGNIAGLISGLETANMQRSLMKQQLENNRERMASRRGLAAAFNKSI